MLPMAIGLAVAAVRLTVGLTLALAAAAPDSVADRAFALDFVAAAAARGDAAACDAAAAFAGALP
jgi:hypothetical protein